MKNVNRRTFIKASTALGASSLIPQSFSIGKPGPSANSKLNIAMIGVGNIGNMAISQCSHENIVAAADVDSSLFGNLTGKHEKAQKFADFRVMLDQMGDQIDAVCISTPDHTHFPATIDAMQRGKHVCTQKPLTHNIWQARTLRKAKAKYGVVTNMVNQGHTSNGIRQMREWYEADVFGQVKEIHLGFPGPNWNSATFKRPKNNAQTREEIPKNLNWDLWLGPCEKTDYQSYYHPMSWRGFYDYGTGQFGDWFCHIGDGPVWILDLYKPTVVECVERGPAQDGMIPDYSIVRFDFPERNGKSACSMFWYDGKINGGTPMKSPPEWDLGKVPDMGSFWYGDKQNGFLDHRSNNPRLTVKSKFKEFRNDVHIPEKYPRVAGGPFKEWIRAIKGEGPEPGSNFDYAAPLSEIALIGVLAQRFGGRIEWNPEKGITNRPELNAFVREPTRKGWEYGGDLWTA